jgi:DNA invertase Pin-like site-specific DNA recombinase
VFEEKRSGTRRNGRDQLDLALKVLSKGDTLVVTRLDRLGRSLRELANIAHEINVAGAYLRVVEQSIDTATTELGACGTPAAESRLLAVT